jgi:nicotinamidase-related amidase
MVEKARSMSGFGNSFPGKEEETALESILRKRAVTDVVIVGLTLEHCVRHTALDAAKRGFQTWVVLEGTKPFEPDSAKTRETKAVLESSGVKLFDTFTDLVAALS